MTYAPFWVPLALLGFAPWMIFTQQAMSLIYQFWIHTERIRRCRAGSSSIFNTPSHHRVHHGANTHYLDRNYGGILIIWDRLFGTFEPEAERVRYRPDQEHQDAQPGQGRLPRVRRDRPRRARADGWRERAGYVFRGPGWSPAGGPTGASSSGNRLSAAGRVPPCGSVRSAGSGHHGLGLDELVADGSVPSLNSRTGWTSHVTMPNSG